MEVLPRRALIVAAHPDDDTIGCAGLIAQMAAGGAAVLAVYVSDGSRSHPGSRRFRPEAVAQLRASEARAALRILGVPDEPVFLDFEDGGLSKLDDACRENAIARIASLVESFSPDAVLAPWIRDPHPDHGAVARLTAAAVARARPDLALTCYEVWLPVRGTAAEFPRAGESREVRLPLDAALLARKRAAILAHTSQATALIDDDPGGFRIDDSLLAIWLRPFEVFHVLAPPLDFRVR